MDPAGASGAGDGSKGSMTDLRDYTLHMAGHGHIDPTWLWRWTEGYEEVRATFRSALDRMNETPEFKFSASSACFYAWVKEADPGMFGEIRERVREGRWDVVGGWWVEPDCNIPSGESFARHGLYSQRFFEREFGVRATVGFNPDSFGHAGTLPQIFSKMGIGYYAYMRPEPVREMDYPDGSTFWWEAADGSRILAYNIQGGYNGDPRLTRWKVEWIPQHGVLNPGQRHILGFFGVGNHGGGPTKLNIQTLIQVREDPSLPNVEFSTLRQYFDAFLKEIPAESVPVIQTDLQHHARGCYSVHAEVKSLNRRAEHALMTAERFAAVLSLIEDDPFPNERLETAWESLLYNQFHDILAGTSIESSYVDTRDQIGGALHEANAILNRAVQRIARRVDTSANGNTIMVVNPLPWPIKETVAAPPIIARELDQPLHLLGAREAEQPLRIFDDRDNPVPVQTVRGGQVGSRAYAFTAEVPALGYRCYHARLAGAPAKIEGALEAGRDFLENDWWRIELDPYAGYIARLYDKKNGVEVLKKGNILAALVDQSDTWSHGYEEWRVEAGRFGGAALDLRETGNVRATVRAVTRFGNSVAHQYVTLHRAVDTIDCRFRVNWQERYTMLKLAYETAIAGGAATCETAYGSQARAANGREFPGQQWLDLTGKVGEKAYGLAVLNDSKYGFDVRDGVVRVTLLRSPAYAHHDPARLAAEDDYPIIDQGWHDIRIRLVPHAGPWEAAGVARAAWALNEPPTVHVESAHGGDLPAWASFLSCPADNVILSVLKGAEDGGDLVVRGYETAGRAVDTTVNLPQLGKSFPVAFAPHEIKTLRIGRDGWQAREVNLLEE